MKKTLSFVLALIVVLSATAMFSFAADSTAEYANVKPVLDGEIDAAWDVTPAQESEYLGDMDGEGISGYTKLLWDEEYLYFLAVVQDETMLQAAAPSTTDSIDLWVSETYSADPDGFPEPGDYIVSISPYNTLGGYYIGSEAAQSKVEFAAKMVDDKSYVVEVKMPWLTEGFEAKAGVEIGYNVSFNNDLDGDGARDSWVSWQDYNGRPYWANTGSLNTVALAGEKVAAPEPEPEPEPEVVAPVEETPAVEEAPVVVTPAAQTFDAVALTVAAAIAACAGIVVSKKRG